MLYTEEGLYLEWKVVSFRADNKSHSSHNKLVWVALQPLLPGFTFLLHGEPAALLLSAFACEYRVYKPVT